MKENEGVYRWHIIWCIVSFFFFWIERGFFQQYKKRLRRWKIWPLQGVEREPQTPDHWSPGQTSLGAARGRVGMSRLGAVVLGSSMPTWPDFQGLNFYYYQLQILPSWSILPVL